MSAEAITNHFQTYHQYGVDIPICLDSLSRLVIWRDRHVAQWPKDVSLFKRVSIKSATTLGIGILLAFAVAEFIVRNMFFFCSLPLQICSATRMLSIRIKQSRLTNLNVILFALAAFKHNFVEQRVGYRITHPRLANYYLAFYKVS